MKFSTLKDIIAWCEKDQVTIGQLMLQEQIKETGKSREETFKQMADYYGIMKEAVHRGIHEPVPSKSGLTGGDAVRVHEYMS